LKHKSPKDGEYLLKLKLPGDEEHRIILNEQLLRSACSTILSAKLINERVLSKIKELPEAKDYCKGKNIPFSEVLFKECYDIAFAELSSFSPSKGNVLTLLHKEEKNLLGHKRFHSYVVTIASFLKTKKEIDLAEVIKEYKITGKAKLEACGLAYALLLETI